MPTNNNPTPSDLKDNDLPKASPITPKIQESQMKSTVTKVMATNETLIQVNNAYFSGKLTKALRLIKPYQEEQAAQPILTKIYALQKFKAKVKKTACNKRAQLFKEASPSIASHPFVLDGPNCKDTQEPPLFMKD